MQMWAVGVVVILVLRAAGDEGSRVLTLGSGVGRHLEERE